MSAHGATGSDTYHCAKGAPCTFDVNGNALDASDSIQVVDNGNTCPSAATSSGFVSTRVVASSGDAATRGFDVGLSNDQGNFIACYCPAFGGCDGDALGSALGANEGALRTTEMFCVKPNKGIYI